MGWRGWKQRQPQREDQDQPPEDDEPTRDSPTAWASFLLRIEFADDLEFFWLEGFGDPGMAHKHQPHRNDNEAFLTDLSAVFKVSSATSPNQGTRIDPGAVALNSMLNTNSTVSQAQGTRQEIAMLQLQQMSYGCHLRVQGKIV
ncbi:MAG: hypothetical protein HY319_14520 [Armatimonadetes bacterium]|nr:hypothetical protein [Armatimonadota bacterium]